MSYFLIYFGEDGISIEVTDKQGAEKLVKDLSQDYPSGIPVLGKPIAKRYYIDGGSYPLNKYLILEGSVVVPQVVSTITEYKFGSSQKYY